MNFKSACDMMKKGYKVYRLGSSCDWYMRASINVSRPVVCNFDDETKDMDQNLYFDDLDAQDWEIIDEKEFAIGILKPKKRTFARGATS